MNPFRKGERPLPPGVRQAREADRQAILDYVSGEPEYNVFITGDLEVFGLEGPDCRVFLRESDPGPGWDWLALEFQNSFVLYSRDPAYDARDVYRLFRDRPIQMVTGKEALLERLLPLYPRGTLSHTYLAKLTQPPPPPEAASLEEGMLLRRLTPEDAPALVELCCALPEWREQYIHRREEAVAQRRAVLRQGDRIYGIFQGGRMVATAASTAESACSAMIVGVGTLPEYRGRGYASRLLGDLCRELLGGGKAFVCLFYNNPAAGRIYHRAGFVQVGQYGLLRPVVLPASE